MTDTEERKARLRRRAARYAVDSSSSGLDGIAMADAADTIERLEARAEAAEATAKAHVAGWTKQCEKNNVIAQERNVAQAKVKALTDPFTHADSADWERLDALLGDSGHGKFWRAVIKELRAALKGDSHG